MSPAAPELPLVARLATTVAIGAVLWRLAALSRTTPRPVAALFRESFRKPRTLPLLMSLVAGSAAVSAPWLATAAMGWLDVRWLPPARSAVLSIAGTLALKALMAACEELVFRGCLLPLLARRIGPAGAVLGSAMVFALVHPARDGFTVLLLLLDGTGLGLVFLLSGSLWAPIAWHLAKNTSLWMLFGRTSLQLGPGLFESHAVGPENWVGAPGQAGLADLIGSLVVMLIAGVAWQKHQSAATELAARGKSQAGSCGRDL